ncbi:RNA polymerase sigma factor [[Flexibacter] sp. ATCC 35208]|uniref:RNA polymerase sigma factor n=1 Tax=[Flexibacter] sp. ATCC 35208 TaxID=1936242 RepID=UPI0009D3F7D2|nr:hypothetical protein [[Flexibacter] sp. ATCC 35208]OMP74856.1 hypothetical protein BW716_33215 [[Flexibacter] sp. ATCC 35208]
MIEDEKEFITQFKEGNPDAHMELYSICIKYLWGRAYSLIKDENSATEVVEKVFGKLWKNRESFYSRKEIVDYLYKTVDKDSRKIKACIRVDGKGYTLLCDGTLQLQSSFVAQPWSGVIAAIYWGRWREWLYMFLPRPGNKIE